MQDGDLDGLAHYGTSIKARLNAQAVRRLVYGEEYPMLEQDHSGWGMRRKPKAAPLLLNQRG